MHILDIQDDPNGVILQALVMSGVGIPGFVKAASLDKKQVWAWPEEERFALDTPADIWLSKHYFSKTASNIPPIRRKMIGDTIDRAIKFAGIQINDLEPPQTKQASIAPTEFALRLKTAGVSEGLKAKYSQFVRDGEIVMYPVGSTEQVKLANLNFPKGLNNELAPMRPMVAQKLASLLPSEDLTEAVKSYLPMTEKEASMQLDMRSGAAAEFSPMYQKAKEFLSPSMDRLKMASLISTIDKQSGLDQKYGSQIKEASVFLRGVVAAEKLPQRLKIKSASVWDSVFDNGAYDSIIPGLSSAEDKQALLDSQPESVKNVLLSEIGAR